MKAIDTNVLVRFLVNDEPAQAQSVRRLFSDAEAQRDSLFVPLLVLVEFGFSATALELVIFVIRFP